MRVLGLMIAIVLLAFGIGQPTSLDYKKRASRQYDAAARSAREFHEVIIAALSDTTLTKDTIALRRDRNGKIQRVVLGRARFGLIRVMPMTLKHGSARYLIPYRTNATFIGAHGKALTKDSVRVEPLVRSRLVTMGSVGATKGAGTGSSSRKLTAQQTADLNGASNVFRSNFARLSKNRGRGLTVENGKLTYDFKPIPVRQDCRSCHQSLRVGDAVGYIVYAYPSLKTLTEQALSYKQRNRIVLALISRTVTSWRMPQRP